MIYHTSVQTDITFEFMSYKQMLYDLARSLNSRNQIIQTYFTPTKIKQYTVILLHMSKVSHLHTYKQV